MKRLTAVFAALLVLCSIGLAQSSQPTEAEIDRRVALSDAQWIDDERVVQLNIDGWFVRVLQQRELVTAPVRPSPPAPKGGQSGSRQGPPSPPQQTPPPTSNTYRIITVNYTLEPLNASRPIVYIEGVGDTLGVARQLREVLILSKTQLAGLSTAPISLIVAPPTGSYIVPRYALINSDGTSFTGQSALLGRADVVMALTNYNSGLYPLVDRVDLSNDDTSAVRGMWRGSLSASNVLGHIFQSAFHVTTLGGFVPVPLRADTGVKILATVNRVAPGMTDAQTWASLVAALPDDFTLRLVVYYQIYKM